MDKKRQRFLFVLVDFRGDYPALNSTWTFWLYLRTWPHFHNFYFPPLSHAWVCTDPACPLGSLIIPTLRPECKNSVFWLRGCAELHGRRHGRCQGLFFFFFPGICWCNPFWLFKRLKPEVTALKRGSLDRNLNYFSGGMNCIQSCILWMLYVCLLVKEWFRYGDVFAVHVP